MSSPDAHASDSAGLLSDAALAALQLRRQPFTVTPADGDHYTDDTTTEQLADIRQALITGDDLLLILGPTGAGKSTLLAQLSANSGLRIQCFSVRGSARFSTRNLFGGMLEAFRDEPGEELRDVLDALVPHLQRMVADNILCTVVLDDADAVAEVELTHLLSGMLYLNSRDETLLRVALAAEEAFEDRIPELLPDGADLPYSGLVVEPLPAERAASYLDFRLNQAGRFDAFPFSEREVEALNARAQGLPLALHAVAADELNARFGPTDDDEDLPAELVEHARRGGLRAALDARGGKIALGAVALALILGGLVLSRPSPEPVDAARYTVADDRSSGQADAAAAGSDEASEARLRLVRELDDARAAAETGAASDSGQTDVPAVGDPAAIADEDRSVAAPAPAPVDEAGGTDIATDLSSGPDVAAAGTTSPGTTSPGEASDERSSEQVARADAPTAPAPASPTVSSPSPDTAPAAALPDVGPDPVSESVPESATAPVIAPAPGFEPAPIEGLESPNWVLVQDPGRFTVQMSASVERESIEDFLVRNALPPPNSIFAFDRDGTTWYALVHGLYDSIDEARTAIERMPAAAQTNQPWIRGVGRIQAALKAGN